MKFIQTILLLSIATCCFAGQPEKMDVEGFNGGIYDTGGFLLSGQPQTKEAMELLKKEGVTLIVNLRTQNEVDNPRSTPIDEAAISEELGMQYVHIPSGGSDHPYSPETLDKFAAAVKGAEGKVLLHCTSGVRASHLWVAYLVQHEGVDVDHAITLGRSANFSRMPIEGYLEGKVSLGAMSENDE